jgi:hypothetical protein
VIVAAFVAAGCGARSELLEEQKACAPAKASVTSQRFGDAAVQVATDLAIDRYGYPLLAGVFRGTLDLGAQSLVSDGTDTHWPAQIWPPGGDLFVARLAPPECAPFAKRFGPARGPIDDAWVITTPDNGAVFAATHVGPMEFGAGTFGTAETMSAVIMQLGPDGEGVWTKGVVSSGDARIARPAVDAKGHVFLAGLFSGTVSVGDDAIGTSAPDRVDAFVAELRPSGELVWSKVITLSSASIGYSALTLAAWPDGRVAVSGVTNLAGGSSTLDLGGGAFVHQSSGGQVNFLTAFDDEGHHLWEKFPFYPWPDDMAVDAQGRLLVLGSAAVLLGMSPEGEQVLSVPIPDTLIYERVAADANGHVLLGGQLAYPGTDAHVPPAGDGVIAAELDASGEFLWSKTFPAPPGSGSRYLAIPALGRDGTPWLAGGFSGALDMGQGTLAAEGAADAFLAELPP